MVLEKQVDRVLKTPPQNPNERRAIIAGYEAATVVLNPARIMLWNVLHDETVERGSGCRRQLF